MLTARSCAGAGLALWWLRGLDCLYGLAVLMAYSKAVKMVEIGIAKCEDVVLLVVESKVVDERNQSINNYHFGLRELVAVLHVMPVTK